MYGYLIRPVVQLEERKTSNFVVAGSNPVGSSNKIKMNREESLRQISEDLSVYHNRPATSEEVISVIMDWGNEGQSPYQLAIREHANKAWKEYLKENYPFLLGRCKDTELGIWMQVRIDWANNIYKPLRLPK